MDHKQLRSVFFYSWSSHSLDEPYYARLVSLLRPLVHQAQLEEWSAQQILGGANVAEVTKKKLESAAYILLLLSPDYLNSERCMQEMQSAIDRQKSGEASVILIRLRPSLLPKELEELLCCLPYNGQPVSFWKKSEKALFDVAQDISLILGLPFDLFPSASTDRERLLKKVYDWIPGMLQSAFERGSRLHLLLEERPDALANPDAYGNSPHVEVQEFKSFQRPLFAGIPIIQVYDDAGGELLILGESGAGKTTLLLELTYKLLVLARNDEKARMPVVFHLSSWATKRQALDIWLVEELKAKYQVQRKIGQCWIRDNQILPLLDGLDEVDEDARVVCIQAIEQYRSLVQKDLVVCCRNDEYLVLSKRLTLRRAVCIQPLTDDQIEHYLQQAEHSTEESMQGLRQVLSDDKELKELIRRPLMLNIFTFAYQGVTVAEVPTKKTLETMQRTVFARYVQKVLNRRGKSNRWKPEHVRHWLAFLARRMRRNDLVLFAVENIQRDWVPERTQILVMVVSVIAVGLIFGSLIGLVSGLIFGANIGQLVGLTMLMLTTTHLKHKLYNGRLSPKALARQLPKYIALSSNESTWHSAKYSLFFSLIGGVASGLEAWWLYRQIWGALCMFVIAMSIGFSDGMGTFLIHFLLRFWLWRSRCLPWNLVAFLNNATERLLLRKVGGTYTFIHRQLLDYFYILSLEQEDLSEIEKEEEERQNIRQTLFEHLNRGSR